MKVFKSLFFIISDFSLFRRIVIRIVGKKGKKANPNSFYHSFFICLLEYRLSDILKRKKVGKEREK